MHLSENVFFTFEYLCDRAREQTTITRRIAMQVKTGVFAHCLQINCLALIQMTLISMMMDVDNHSHRRRCSGGRMTSPHQRRTRRHLHASETVVPASSQQELIWATLARPDSSSSEEL